VLTRILSTGFSLLSSLELQVALGVRNGGLGIGLGLGLGLGRGRKGDGVTACNGRGACESGRMCCACGA